MTTLQPTTKLEAVNVMLTSIGEAPVNSLISGLEDAELAETILESVNKETQSKGWIFNTDLKVTLGLNADNEIVPINKNKQNNVCTRCKNNDYKSNKKQRTQNIKIATKTTT